MGLGRKHVGTNWRAPATEVEVGKNEWWLVSSGEKNRTITVRNFFRPDADQFTASRARIEDDEGQTR